MPIILDATTIASLCLHQGNLDIQLGQTEHRINLVSYWNVKEGDNVLELGCGQGDCTAVLAAAVGSNGSVTAVDPASLDYGAPFTLGRAQSHLAASTVGKQIKFVQDDPLTFIQSTSTIYDVAVLAHCIWYFASPLTLLNILRALSTRAKRICIAEYALAASESSAVPHLLAALTEASLECRKPESTSNIRTVLSPKRIEELSAEAQLVLDTECVLKAPAGMYDGRWEVGTVLSDRFKDEVQRSVQDERERGVVEALRDAVWYSKASLPSGVPVSTMDVWCAVFKRV